ncbi:DNA polymerase sliding clamp [Metallosphaera hakonensis]|uniref:DNA polymerase sliding clamp n=1 Tax=Metallosphaera hakonensis JCM 8857 = DSM 7519 TaxID=1293036 RepID=A0A2U9IV27_9CREN|nr:DNA polymerase sliding clamp [Metallosphaera hakonensis]AWR99909.1 DNA polymerase sliding clamp [Metallosphaera hakonensis JCM 8857 = DSM 7519]
MKFKVIDANSIASIFRTLGEFMPEVTVVGTKEGIRLSGVDPARVAFIDVFIPQGYFHEYQSAEKELVTVRLEEVINSLKNIKKNDSLTFETGDSNLLINLDGDFERTFYLPILTGEPPNNPSIKLEFAFKAKMLTSTYVNVMQILGDLGETVVISSEGGKVVMSVEGDIGTSRIELSEESGTLLEAVGSEAKGIYGMDYLSKTTKMRSSSDVVEIMFGSQLPLKLRFELPQEGYGDFYIAPRSE